MQPQLESEITEDDLIMIVVQNISSPKICVGKYLRDMALKIGLNGMN